METGCLSKLPAVDKKGWPWDIEVDPSIYNEHNEWPKISIVTPSYGQGHFIEETIRSILLQNYPNLEYIVMDGGSKDSTVDVLKSYDEYITKWVSERDEGQSDAINKGIGICTGHIVNWLNSDDFLEPEALYHVAKGFIENPEAHIVSGGEYHIKGAKIEKKRTGTTVHRLLEETLYAGHIDQPSTFWLLEKFREVGPVKKKLHFLMDAELWMGYLLRYGSDAVIKIPNYLVRFRLHEDSKTVSQSKAFWEQRCALRLAFFKQLNAPAFLLEAFEAMVEQTVSFDWPIDQRLDTNKLCILAADDMFRHHYYEKNYAHSRACLKYVVARKGWSLEYFKYWVKLKLLPTGVLNYLRG